MRAAVVISGHHASAAADISIGQRAIQRLRDDDAVVAAVNRAKELARSLDIDADLPPERQRKVPRRLDDNAANAVNLSPMEKLKV